MSGERAKTIRCYESDVEALRTKVKQEFISHHPEIDGMYVSDAFLIRKLIKHYLE